MEKLAAPIFGILTWIVPGITYGALAAAYGLYVNRNYPGFSGIGVAYIVASAVWCAGALAGLTFATISLLRREKYRFLGIIGLIVYILASLFCIGQILLIFFLWVTQ